MQHKKLKLEELNRISLKEFKETDKKKLVILLDNIRSLNNIGSVFRTSDAFMVEKIILCGITAKPPHREIQKTALGATESVNWEYYENITEAIAALKNEHYSIYAIEQTENSIMLNEFNPEKNENIAVIMGNEVEGVQQEVIELCDGVIEIPQHGTKHSLNISVSCGIVVWDLFNKLN